MSRTQSKVSRPIGIVVTMQKFVNLNKITKS